MKMTIKWLLPLLMLGVFSMTVFGQEAAEVAEAATEVAAEAAEATEEAAEEAVEYSDMDNLLLTTNNVWMMVCTALVFLMHLGFASLECGLTRAKNTVNILFKNTAIITIGILTYFLMGFNIL